MRTVTNVIYEASDYEKAKNMSVNEVIELLNRIDSRWISDSGYCDSDYYEGNEYDYELYRLHVALWTAIRLLEGRKETEK